MNAEVKSATSRFLKLSSANLDVKVCGGTNGSGTTLNLSSGVTENTLKMNITSQIIYILHAIPSYISCRYIHKISALFQKFMRGSSPPWIAIKRMQFPFSEKKI